MRTKLILHVGTPKTGTTAFQAAMAESAKTLQQARILYPLGRLPRGRFSHQWLFLGLVSPESRLQVGFQSSGPWPDFDTEAAALRKEISDTGCKTLVISNEMLWPAGNFSRDALSRIRDAFADYDTHIAVVLRNIPSQAMSGYAQRIMGPQKYSGSFAEHVRNCLERKVWDYADRLNVFADVFGQDAVHAYWYPKPSDVLAPPFMHLLELDADMLRKLPFRLETRNRSPGWSKIAEQLAINRLAKKSPPLALLARAGRRVGVTRLMMMNLDPDPATAPELQMLQGMQESQKEQVEGRFIRPAFDLDRLGQ